MRTATHAKTVMGPAPTNRQVQATFWEMHRLDVNGRIVETWNLMDCLAIVHGVAFFARRSLITR